MDSIITLQEYWLVTDNDDGDDGENDDGDDDDGDGDDGDDDKVARSHCNGVQPARDI